MPIEKQVVQLPFGTGQDEFSKSELVEPPHFTRLENVVVTKAGSLQKRFGTEQLPILDVAGGSITNIKSLSSFRDETVLHGKRYLYSYTPGIARWVKDGYGAECVARRRALVATSDQIHESDIAYVKSNAGGFIATAHVIYTNAGTSQIIVADIRDAATGAVVIPQAKIANALIAGGTIKLISLGSAFYLFFTESGTAGLRCVTFDVAGYATAWSAATTVDSSAGPITLAATTYQTAILVSYKISAGPKVRTILLNSSLSILATRDMAYAAGSVVSIDSSVDPSGNLFVAYSWTNVGFYESDVFALDAATLAVTGTQLTVLSTSASVGIVATSASNATVVISSSTTQITRWAALVITAGAVTSPYLTGTIYNMRAISRPALIGGMTCVLTDNYDSIASVQTQPTAFMMQLLNLGMPSGRAIATIAPRLVQTANGDNTRTSIAYDQTNLRYISTVQVQNGADSTRVDGVTFDLNHKSLCLSDELNGVLAVSGGTPLQYDGTYVSELAYLSYPLITATAAGAAGALTGTYSYIAVYEWMTPSGVRMQSAPSLPVTLAGLAAQKGTVTVRSLTNTMHGDFNFSTAPASVVTIALYRTVASGTVYYRCTTVTGTTNTLSAATLTVTDNTTDASIVTNELLYAQPGVAGAALPRLCPPSLSCITQHANRIFGVGDDGRTLWYSSFAVQGEGLWFNDLFTIETPGEQEVTALASYGSLIVFKRDQTFVLSGSGPAENGQGNDFTDVNEIPIGMGCIDPRSVAVVPMGVLFQSAKGIHLLTKAYDAEYIGKAVEDTLATYPIITSAVHQISPGRVLFTAITTAGTTGVTLVWDYIHNVWSVFKRRGSGSNADSPAFAGVLAGPAASKSYVFAEYAGYPFREATTSDPYPYRDNGTITGYSYVFAAIETGWIRPAGIQGFHRLWNVQFLVNSTAGDTPYFRASFAFNYEANYQSVHEFDGSTIVNGGDAYPIRIHVGSNAGERQKAMSIRIKLEEREPGGGIAGKGYTYLGLGLEVGVRRGTYKTINGARRQ